MLKLGDPQVAACLPGAFLPELLWAEGGGGNGLCGLEFCSPAFAVESGDGVGVRARGRKVPLVQQVTAAEHSRGVAALAAGLWRSEPPQTPAG